MINQRISEITSAINEGDYNHTQELVQSFLNEVNDATLLQELVGVLDVKRFDLHDQDALRLDLRNQLSDKVSRIRIFEHNHEDYLAGMQELLTGDDIDGAIDFATENFPNGHPSRVEGITPIIDHLMEQGNYERAWELLEGEEEPISSSAKQFLDALRTKVWTEVKRTRQETYNTRMQEFLTTGDIDGAIDFATERYPKAHPARVEAITPIIDHLMEQGNHDKAWEILEGEDEPISSSAKQIFDALRTKVQNEMQ
ncbi:hypothetical protein GF362_01240 [Candidatus Dojkabacteria bacterium]|nr:hypothetical protein [Candidatus Dojkabacteria bacterium]